MDSKIKKSEINVYDEEDKNRPKYNSLWDNNHQKALLNHGPEGEFQNLIQNHALSGDVLVLGCGKGQLVQRLADSSAERNVYGIEISQSRLNEAYDKNESKSAVLRSDAENLPFSSGVFDVVIAHSVLHHLPKWDTKALDEIVRVLNKNGRLLFYEPGKYNPPAALRRKFIPSRIHTPDEKPFSPAELNKTLLQNFKFVSMTGHCIFSNVIPVIDNYVPYSIPNSITFSIYDKERKFMSIISDQPAWILTGIAKKPFKNDI